VDALGKLGSGHDFVDGIGHAAQVLRGGVDVNVDDALNLVVIDFGRRLDERL